MEGYREAARAVRALGYKCIEKRIRAIQKGEEIPNDILSQILQIKSMTLSVYYRLITEQRMHVSLSLILIISFV